MDGLMDQRAIKSTNEPSDEQMNTVWMNSERMSDQMDGWICQRLIKSTNGQ